MKKIWIKAENDPNYKNTDDWNHAFTLSTTPIVLDPNEENDFTDIFEVECEDHITEFYVVLFFFENYFADHYVFDNLTDATKAFYENISTRQELRNEDEIQVIEKSYNGEIASSVYEINNHYYTPKYIWPDKSTRWILKKFDLSDIDV